MKDIIIYTTPEELLHKQDKLEGDKDKGSCGIYYWEFSRLPKELTNNGRIYFATKGFIRGYFMVEEILEYGESLAEIPYNSITWSANSWKDIKPIPTKSFQGFKYADKVPELNKCVKSETAEVKNENRI